MVLHVNNGFWYLGAVDREAGGRASGRHELRKFVFSPRESYNSQRYSWNRLSYFLFLNIYIDDMLYL